MALATNLLARIRAVLTGTADHATPQAAVELSQSIELETGTGSNQADKIFSDQRTLSASASEDLDLAGVLADLLGSTITFVKVKAIFIKAAAGNTNNVVVGNGSNPFLGGFGSAAHTWAIPPGGMFMVAAPVSGWSVTAGSADILKVANSGAGSSVTYDIVVIGTSA